MKDQHVVLNKTLSRNRDFYKILICFNKALGDTEHEILNVIKK